MNRRNLAATAAAAVALGAGTACSSGSDHSSHSGMPTSAAATSTSASSGHGHMHEMDGGPAPANMTPAKNPRFPVGSRVTLTTDHMDGMKNAPATVVGAYRTATYAVNYQPTTGGAMVKNHKWVVQQELKSAGTKHLADGEAVTITADHMDGMQGAEGTIASSTTQTVYMVDYTADGMTMKNHKWVVEDEMKSR